MATNVRGPAGSDRPRGMTDTSTAPCYEQIRRNKGPTVSVIGGYGSPRNNGFDAFPGLTVATMPRNETNLEDRQRMMRERHTPVEATPRPGVVAFERHYNPKELASIWCLDQTTVRRLFQDGARRTQNREVRTTRREERLCVASHSRKCCGPSTQGALEMSTMRDMSQLYRRHSRTCPHRKNGRRHTKCKCVIAADGELNGEAVPPFHRSSRLATSPCAKSRLGKTQTLRS